LYFALNVSTAVADDKAENFIIIVLLLDLLTSGFVFGQKNVKTIFGWSIVSGNYKSLHCVSKKSPPFQLEADIV